MQYCGRTGEVHCKCLKNRQVKPITALQVDLRLVMRKLFTDHAQYNLIVVRSITYRLPDTDVFVARLNANQKDIGDQVAPIVGQEKGFQLTQALLEHIKLAGDATKSATYNKPDLEENIKKLYANGDQVAAIFSSFNPDKLDLKEMITMFRTHNTYELELGKANLAKDFLREQQLYDAYYNELLEMADQITDALM